MPRLPIQLRTEVDEKGASTMLSAETNAPRSIVFSDADRCAQAIVDSVGYNLRLAVPVSIGKPILINSWTAAIQTKLRSFFGGVFSGKAYRPRFALVETANKRAVVKINDVGPLKPGRIIDLNEQAMRYFDPTMQRGVIESVKVTPLVGEHWIAGPA